jgi:hypothetical protein
MSYDDSNEFQDVFDKFTQKVQPVVRVYISYVTEGNDMLDIPQTLQALCTDGKSPIENIKDIMDKGMVNIYACSFNNVHKVI